jgi:hypothetical protein
MEDDKKQIKLETKKEDDKKDIKLETNLKDEEGNIKITGTAPKMTTGKKRPASADDVRRVNENLNRNTDMEFWKQASGNELRNHILQRTGGNREDLRVKDKKQLLDIIRKMIREGTW